ncbi:MAG: tetratricopeptide repeat protein [Elusimicrobiota bacterium]
MMKRRTHPTFFVGCCLLVLGICIFYIFYHKKEKNYLIKNPSQYLPAEKLNKIILKTKSKIEENPEDIFSYIENGIANYQKGREFYPVAINQLRTSLKLGAMDIRIPFYLGIMYDELGLTDKAFSYYEKFLRNQPKDIYIRLRYGNLFFRQNRYELASEHYEIACNFSPKNQTALLNLALSYKARGMYNEALEIFKRAEGLRSQFSTEILIKVAETYFAKTDFANAETYYKKAVEQKADSVSALIGLAELYLKTDKKNEARYYFQKALAVEPDNAKAKKYLSTKKAG